MAASDLVYIKKILNIIALTGLLLIAFSPALSAEELGITVTFSNPSEIDPKDEEARYYLPPEIKFIDVVDKGGLELTYDETRSLYYLHKQILLQPGEKKQFKIVIQNVWKVDEEEIRFLKTQTKDRLDALEGTDVFEEASAIGEEILRELDRISTQQLIAGEAEPEKKIDLFRVNKERLRQIRATVLLLEDYKTFIEDEVEMKKLPKMISLMIKVRNTSDTEPKKQMVTQYLAEGVNAEHIRDLQGFKVNFDPEKRLYYLTREVDLKPGEQKSFTLTIEDRWIIRDEKLEVLVQEADGIVLELADTEFDERGQFLMKEILRLTDVIRDLQSRKVSIKDKMANHKDNEKRLDVIKNNILELKRMLEIMRERDRQKRLEEILRRVFKEAAWKIIYGTIFLLGIISLLTYILWWGQTKKKQSETYEDVE